MFVDLYHNYIVKNTITEAFAESVEKKLSPRLEAKYGSALLGIQMYEDFISDAFYAKGEWYYPLTVILPEGPATQWVKWRMKAGSFKDGSRVADINPELWCGLFLANREKVADEIDKYMEQLDLWRKALRAGDGEQMKEMMRTAAARRKELY